MPELAEVEHSRRRWDAGIGSKVAEVIVRRPDGRIYRGTDVTALRSALKGARLLESEARGKQMIFRFSGKISVGIHLGMRGEIRCEEPQGAELNPRKHDYFILRMNNGVVLVFEDIRLFGRVRFHQGNDLPEWWSSLPPSVTSAEFTFESMAEFLSRRAGTAIKAVLLMQDRFPGVGNWMADEILWRAHIHPATPAGRLDVKAQKALYRAVRWVCSKAVEIMDADWGYPNSWLFSHRWQKGGDCPRCKTPLDRGTVGGRTTAWCPECQPRIDSGPSSPGRPTRKGPTKRQKRKTSR